MKVLKLEFFNIINLEACLTVILYFFFLNPKSFCS